ncbi:protein DYAD-like [Prunus yedoensis var. nudiflora]|uniref:Protein DYAD-like n=1 Tax=Prunus yedoensis var. nudiflora TaxID=2094558 RepID=A0A314UWF4_PRUYE|nr:protein DYAD-like [Prunus yedoensis var. nudiflora]
MKGREMRNEYFQLDQCKLKLLPSITPTQLMGARVVMASEIDRHTVCVACPSIHSLSLHIHITERGYQFGNLIPALDVSDIWTASKEGPCFSELKFTRILQWGSSTDKEEVKAKARDKGIEVIVLDDDDDIEQENEEFLNLRRSRKKRKLEDLVARARWLAEWYKLENEKVEKLSIEVTKLKREAVAALTTSR